MPKTTTAIASRAWPPQLDGEPFSAASWSVCASGDFRRADRIGEFSGNPKTRAFAELLMDREEDRTLRAVLVGMRRETKSEPPTYAIRPRQGLNLA
jgi:hypothetical protein